MMSSRWALFGVLHLKIPTYKSNVVQGLAKLGHLVQRVHLFLFQVQLTFTLLLIDERSFCYVPQKGYVAVRNEEPYLPD